MSEFWHFAPATSGPKTGPLEDSIFMELIQGCSLTSRGFEPDLQKQEMLHLLRNINEMPELMAPSLDLVAFSALARQIATVSKVLLAPVVVDAWFDLSTAKYLELYESNYREIRKTKFSNDAIKIFAEDFACEPPDVELIEIRCHRLSIIEKNRDIGSIKKHLFFKMGEHGMLKIDEWFYPETVREYGILAVDGFLCTQQVMDIIRPHMRSDAFYWGPVPE